LEIVDGGEKRSTSRRPLHNPQIAARKEEIAPASFAMQRPSTRQAALAVLYALPSAAGFGVGTLTCHAYR
jgi:hypothetical protein